MDVTLSTKGNEDTDTISKTPYQQWLLIDTVEAEKRQIIKSEAVYL